MVSNHENKIGKLIQGSSVEYLFIYETQGNPNCFSFVLSLLTGKFKIKLNDEFTSNGKHFFLQKFEYEVKIRNINFRLVQTFTSFNLYINNQLFVPGKTIDLNDSKSEIFEQNEALQTKKSKFGSIADFSIVKSMASGVSSIKGILSKSHEGSQKNKAVESGVNISQSNEAVEFTYSNVGNNSVVQPGNCFPPNNQKFEVSKITDKIKDGLKKMKDDVLNFRLFEMHSDKPKLKIDSFDYENETENYLSIDFKNRTEITDHVVDCAFDESFVVMIKGSSPSMK